ncbi:uncharacterized protein UV8b_01511 [Ustilaginoidea virens]|uniref:Protein kinase domain-containing protein n=1 Tax=Ustilaginoidea virens TaxID=1159556 RepID=A0A8E5HKS2_USTVR|nr:uncharacterized protein UV8b_01511 [Ustilaginoidea virens]QUC17270.1 hypothetical protein UV8b_01511 [Ustilaginoidea virens]
MADRGGSEAEPHPAVAKWHSDALANHLDLSTRDHLPLVADPDQVLEPNPSATARPTLRSSHDGGSRRVVTGLPRSQTFERKLSEQREHLEPVPPTADERKAASADVRSFDLRNGAGYSDPRSHASGLVGSHLDPYASESAYHSASEHGHYQLSNQSLKPALLDSITRRWDDPPTDSYSVSDAASVTASQHEAMIADELERKWILNLSMHFRDRSKREKFFVTYREKDHLWRRVTISLDYRNAPPNSLEFELTQTRYQREKSAKIYEAIRESLSDIQFYDTVTNLKLQTTDGRLHVHVVEDGNEIIHYPTAHQVCHLNCRRVRERDLFFDAHMSGFVYKVRVQGRTLIKKEIPSPDTIEEFLYEVNALSSLRYSRHVVQLYGLVVDDKEQVRGLLISYAEQGALIDIIYDNCKERNVGLSWQKRQRWARQIVEGLADIHESGFVQGDFTLSNIVVDASDDAKIIDINRRGCPVGWEPPEASPLIEAHHRITMYIGVKSDLYQLGMVLWGLAMLEDEPETHGRPLMLGPEINVPDWYRQVTEICLSVDPRMRLQASALLEMFPPDTEELAEPVVVDNDAHSSDGHSIGSLPASRPYMIRTVEPAGGWQYSSQRYTAPSPDMYEPYYHPRGRSPPSPLPSHFGGCESPHKVYSSTSWAANRSVRPSYSDVAEGDANPDGNVAETVLRPETPLSLGKHDIDSAAYIPADVKLEDISPKRMTASAADKKRSLGDGLQMLSTPRLSRKDTVVYAPVRIGSAEKEAVTHEAGVLTAFSAKDVAIHGTDGSQASDLQELRTSDSDFDGGVSLESEVDQMSKDAADHPALIAHPTRDEGLSRKENLLAAVAQGKGTSVVVDSEQSIEEEETHQSNSLPASATMRRRGYDSAASGNPDTKNGGLPYMRQQSLPLSLAGIGSGVNFEHDAKAHGESIADDDLQSALERPATVQAFTGTTVSQKLRMKMRNMDHEYSNFRSSQG